MEPKKIERINALARKSKSPEGLTEAQKLNVRRQLLQPPQIPPVPGVSVQQADVDVLDLLPPAIGGGVQLGHILQNISKSGRHQPNIAQPV